VRRIARSLDSSGYEAFFRFSGLYRFSSIGDVFSSFHYYFASVVFTVFIVVKRCKYSNDSWMGYSRCEEAAGPSIY
jgi:hypothetical protein